MKDRAKRKAQVLLPPPRNRLDLRFLLSNLATDHFRARHDASKVYSLPSQRVAQQFEVQPLRQHLQSQPLLKAPNAAAAADGMMLDTDDTDFHVCMEGPDDPDDAARFQGIRFDCTRSKNVDCGPRSSFALGSVPFTWPLAMIQRFPADPDLFWQSWAAERGIVCSFSDSRRAVAGPRIYFRVVHTNPSNQKRLPLPAAAGGSLRKDHLTVCLVDMQDEGGTRQLDLSGFVGAALHDRVVTLTCLHSDPQKLRTDLLEHQDDKTLQYSFDVPIVGLDVHAAQPIMDKLFDAMVGSLQTRFSFVCFRLFLLLLLVVLMLSLLLSLLLLCVFYFWWGGAASAPGLGTQVVRSGGEHLFWRFPNTGSNQCFHPVDFAVWSQGRAVVGRLSPEGVGSSRFRFGLAF
jgi:hypothetical protein